jgi:uncharacterized protein Yka (UPF0111/DUF47 family)
LIISLPLQKRFQLAQKALIINELGEEALLLPMLVNNALVANEQAKYYFSLYQTAKNHLLHPEAPLENLQQERIAAGVDDAALDGAVESAHRLADDMCRIAGAGGIYTSLLASLETMMLPFDAVGQHDASDEADSLITGFRKRFDALQAAAPEIKADTLPLAFIDGMTHGTPDLGDSFHLLVMDLHRSLNKLQQGLAEEVIDEASVYQILAGDRPLVAAFMRGLNRTRPLKFDHPGLGTTATRIGSKLVLQNDIGTTDAHVLVIHVEPPQITFTYTDVHLNRLQFFRNLFRPYEISWTDTATRTVKGYENDNYYLTMAAYSATDGKDLEKYLEYLGSRIVFLIDWNKARKRLRGFVRNREAVKLLEWAARNDYGHRAFLEMGGEQLINQAIEYAAGEQIHYGEKLEQILGHDQAIGYLKYVLQSTSEGLRAGRSGQLIRDGIKTELLKYFQTSYQTLISHAERHAELIHDIASATNKALVHTATGESAEFAKRAARQSKHWEHQADGILNEVRALLVNTKTAAVFQQIMEEADDAADSLEESAFLLTLLPEESTRELFVPLKRLFALLVEASQAFVKCLESARYIQRAGEQLDLEDFLEAIDCIVRLEHETDNANRDVTVAIIKAAANCRELHLFSELSRTQEEAADSLARSSLLVRDYVLNEVIRA